MFVGVVGVSCRGVAGVLSDLTGLVGVCGVGAGLLGDPGEQFGLVGQQRGAFGGVVGEAMRAQPGEVVEELGDLAGGDRLGG